MFGGPDLLPAGAYVTEPPPETELTVLFRERKLSLVFDMIAGPDQHPNTDTNNMKCKWIGSRISQERFGVHEFDGADRSQ